MLKPLKPNAYDTPRWVAGRHYCAQPTEGDPLPESPDWKNPEKHQELTAYLLAFAASRGIRVTAESLGRETQGVSTGGAIVPSPMLALRSSSMN